MSQFLNRTPDSAFSNFRRLQPSFGFCSLLLVVASCLTCLTGCRAIQPAMTPPPPFHDGMQANSSFESSSRPSMGIADGNAPGVLGTHASPQASLVAPFTSHRVAMLDLVDHSQLPGLLDNGGPVLVDFYAEWCQPCQQQGEVLQQLAIKDLGNARIVKVNVDKHAELARMFRVEGLPTLVLFKEGQAVSRKTGFASEDELTRLLID